jgi:indolepyruvate ferredoxin oxidoreductase alpha subunit
MHSSQNEQDSRHYAIAAKLPMLEPASSQECLDFAKAAFQLSEEYDTPVMLRLCTRISHSQSIVETGERANIPQKPYEKDAVKYIMMPGNAIRRHPIVEERTQKLAALAENCAFNRVEMGGTDLGIITSGTCYQYVKEIFGDSVSVLKLGLINPMPTKLLRDFAAQVKRLVVVEELDGIIEAHCKAIGLSVEGKDLFTPLGEYSQKTIAKVFGLPEKDHLSIDTPIPARPPMMCAGCPHRGMYYVLAKNKCTVIGDIGCYTLGAQAPLQAVDSTLCMGASVSGLHGFNKAQGKAGEQKSVAVIGDSTFIHSGVTGLINIAYNGSNSTVIILDNSITGMTGHQQNPTTGYNIKGDPAGKIDLETLCRAVGIRRVQVVDPYDLDACDRALKEELAAEEPSVIISRRPCVLLKYVKAKTPLHVNEPECRGCKKCMKFGCPAIAVHGKKASIDPTLCVGCGVCQQVCPFGAFEEEK